MKVIVKKPNLSPEICEVSGISEINQIVGNVDKKGIGYNHGSSDIRMSIGKNIDMYVKEDAINNFDLEQNLWAPNNNAVFFGNIVFAGYDQEKTEDAGACSLTDEQIALCFVFIAKQTV